MDLRPGADPVVADAFVTGGSGFVGGALVQALVAGGRGVHALARSDEAAEVVRSLGAQPVRGDLEDPAALLAGMRGCSTVFHAAGVNAMCMRDPAPMLRTNIDGTVAVVRSAAAAGVDRVVYTSSAATVGERQGETGREDSHHRGTFLSAYERSKFLAERAALDGARDSGVPLVCVNPSSVQGPGRIGGSARLLIDLVNGRLPVLTDTVVSVVDIRDCTGAHLLAETHGRPGARYLINGASIEAREAVAVLRRVCGRPGRTLFAPRWLVRGAGAVAGRLAGRVRPGGPLCPEMVRTLLHGHRYDGSLAVRELGLRYTSFEETVVRTLSWYADRGLAPAPAEVGQGASTGTQAQNGAPASSSDA
jgi:dihydroflavonol-4-reductase